MSDEIPQRRQRDMSFAVHLSDAQRGDADESIVQRVASLYPIHVHACKTRMRSIARAGPSIDGKRAYRPLFSRESSILWRAIV